MKRKVKVVDNISGKIIIGEIELRNKDHFDIQLKNPAHIFKNKKKYTRKLKYKDF